MSLVMSLNEDAFEFITGEAEMTTISDGSVPLDNSRISDFVHLAERAHMSCAFC